MTPGSPGIASRPAATRGRWTHRLVLVVAGGLAALAALLLASNGVTPPSAAAAAAAQAGCPFPTDKQDRPMQPLEKPPVGGCYVDPSFGARVCHVAAPSRGGSDAVVKPMYATMPAWNADETRMILWQRGSGHQLYDGRTYAFIRKLNFISPSDIEQILMDPIDPDVVYYPSKYNAIPILYRYRFSTDHSEPVRDFRTAPTNCPVSWGATLGLGRDPQYMSWDSRRRIGMQCGPKQFTYEISTDTVLGMTTLPGQNAAIVAPSGELMFRDAAVMDLSFNVLRRLAMKNPFEHGCIGTDGTDDTYAAVGFDDPDDENGTVVLHDLRTGRKRVIVGPATGYPYPPGGTHLTAISQRRPGWVVATTTGGTPLGQKLLQNEILLVSQRPGGPVYRIAHHRSKAGEGSWGYWAEAHPAISPSGTRVVFGSDWGGGPSVDSYVVEIPEACYWGDPVAKVVAPPPAAATAPTSTSTPSSDPALPATAGSKPGRSGGSANDKASARPARGGNVLCDALALFSRKARRACYDREPAPAASPSPSPSPTPGT